MLNASSLPPGDASTGERRPDTLIGQTLLGQYCVRALLGEGGFGSVYQADHVRTGTQTVLRKCVVKVARPDVIHSDESIKRFELEAKALAKLNHQNLITLYSFGELEDRRMFLVMEYGGDESLAELLRHEKRLEPVRALAIAEQLCQALSEAHEHQIMHRDVKPSNVVLDRHGGREIAKLVDLGIAKMMRSLSLPVDPSLRETLTGADTFIGTAQYASPEQAQGRPIDGRSDLYSLGVVLYEMLTGRLPVRAANTSAYLIAHVTDAPDPLSADGTSFSRRVKQLVSRALAKKADRRFQSAEEMRRAIHAVRMGEEASRGAWIRPASVLAGALILSGAGVIALRGARPQGDGSPAVAVRDPDPQRAAAIVPPAAAPGDGIRIRSEKPMVVRTAAAQVTSTEPRIAFKDEGEPIEIGTENGDWTVRAIVSRRNGAAQIRFLESRPAALAFAGDRLLDHEETTALTANPTQFRFRSPKAASDLVFAAGVEK